MLFDFNLYSSLLLPFFIQGIVFAAILFLRGIREERLSDRLLGWLLLLNAIKIAYWMFGFAGWYDSHDAYSSFMFYFPFNNILWMGPLLYFYFLSLTNTSFRFQKKDYRHFILPFLFLLLIIAKWVIDFGLHRPFAPGVQTQFGTKGPLADLEKNDWVDLAGYLSFFYYLIITIRAFRNYQLYTRQHFSGTEEIRFDWLRNLLYAIAAAVIIFLLFNLAGRMHLIRQTYVFDWYAYLALGIIVYYLSIAGYALRADIKQELHFVPEEKGPVAVISGQETKLAGLEEWKVLLLQTMEKEKLYLDPALNLTQLSKKLEAGTGVVSRVINEGTGQNFNDFVNEYRVKAVIEKLKAGEQKTQTLLGIAFDCGFNSKATFNRAFKKVMNASPKEWLGSR